MGRRGSARPRRRPPPRRARARAVPRTACRHAHDRDVGEAAAEAEEPAVADRDHRQRGRRGAHREACPHDEAGRDRERARAALVGEPRLRRARPPRTARARPRTRSTSAAAEPPRSSVSDGRRMLHANRVPAARLTAAAAARSLARARSTRARFPVRAVRTPGRLGRLEQRVAPASRAVSRRRRRSRVRRTQPVRTPPGLRSPRSSLPASARGRGRCPSSGGRSPRP